jgi:hypothetical protein
MSGWMLCSRPTKSSRHQNLSQQSTNGHLGGQICGFSGEKSESGDLQPT